MAVKDEAMLFHDLRDAEIGFQSGVRDLQEFMVDFVRLWDASVVSGVVGDPGMMVDVSTFSDDKGGGYPVEFHRVMFHPRSGQFDMDRGWNWYCDLLRCVNDLGRRVIISKLKCMSYSDDSINRYLNTYDESNGRFFTFNSRGEGGRVVTDVYLVIPWEHVDTVAEYSIGVLDTIEKRNGIKEDEDEDEQKE